MFIFFLSFSVIAQYRLKGRIIDAISNEPIGYVAVQNITRNNLFYTGENGEFDFIAQKKDSINFRIVGYDIFQYVNNNLDTTKLVVKLDPRPVILKEIVISNIHKTVELGYHGKRGGDYLGSEVIGLENAVYISNPDQTEKQILNIKLHLRTNNENILFKLHLYAVNLTSFMPEDEITPKDLTYLHNSKDGTLASIDISEFGIQLPVEGIFISFEWIGQGGNSNVTKPAEVSLGFFKSKTMIPVWMRRNNSKWLKDKILKINNDFIVPKLGITVAE